MKKKGLIWLTTFLFVICVSSLAEASYKWSQLGRAPIMPSVIDKIELQEKFSSCRGDILEGLRMAEPTWNASEIFQSLETAIRSDRGVTETSFAFGQKFEWMIFKPRGRVGIVRDVEWSGKESLEGFLITCVCRDSELKFFLAKKCGNIALLEKKILPQPRVEMPPPLPKVEVPQPPPPRYAEPASLPPPPPPREYVYVYPPPPSPEWEGGYREEGPVVSYFPLPLPFLFPFSYYRDRNDFYSPRYYSPRYYSTRYYSPRYHQPRDYQQRQHYQPRVRPPTVRTVPPAVRPPTVRTVPSAVSSRGSSMSQGSTSRRPGVQTR